VFIEEENKRKRILAVERFNNGESPGAICVSLGKSKSWLYKLIERYIEDDDYRFNLYCVLEVAVP
jgi:hypothetical protein